MCLNSSLLRAATLAALLAPVLPGVAPAAPTAEDSLMIRVRQALGGNRTQPTSAARELADSARVIAPLPPRLELPRTGATPSAVDTARGIDAIPWVWQTNAERTRWARTGDYDETMRYCRQLEAGSRWVKLLTYGTSEQGRALPLLVVSRDRAFTPAAARATGKPIVLVQNGIHSGEIEGKDASLALVRDMAVLGSRANLLDSAIVLVLPIYSVDAHERRSRFNRINQNGPEEMGWRATPTGLNLNRDYMKADAPETRALLSAVYTTWWPDLLVDDHTTDGADYRHDLTYGFPHGPMVPAPVERWLTDAIEGRVMRRLERLGHLPAPYLSFRRGNDPRSGIDFGWTPPRLSTGYPPLHGRAALLVETHMLKPYGDRVRATYDLLAAVLEELRARPRALTDAVRASEREIVARAGATGAGRTVVLAGRTSDRAGTFLFHGKQTAWETSDITGAPVARYGAAPWDSLVPIYREVLPTLSVQEPAGYVIPREWSDAIDLLRLHGVQTRTLAAAWSDTVEMTRVLEWHTDSAAYEGHHPVRVTRVGLERQWRTFQPGDVWVSMAQPGALVAVNLCEAQAPDGLMAWNAFDTVLQKKEYGEDYVVEPMARRMLEKDPALAKEFRDRLANDPAFAANPFARADFFYRRSPWADPEQDLMPIARALRVVPEQFLAPAAGR